MKQTLLILYASLLILSNVGCNVISKSSSVPKRKVLANAETQTIKIAVVIEDPIIDGKRFHQLGKWNNPRDQYLKTKS